MARLISDMLETARLETIGLELDLEPVDLVSVVNAAVEEMRPLLGASHRFTPAEPRKAIAVVADRKRLTTLLTNLIDNAIKYSPAGGDIDVDCEHDDRVARVVVRDHGIGINDEQAHLLFTRFGRLVTPETSHIRGTGLGLYLARETARLHGGDIQVDSTPGGGSTFTVVLPLA
jgi:signal transduction histidine kinase